MSDKSYTRIEKMKSGVFSHNDIVSIDINLEKSGSKSYCENIKDLVENVFLEDVENILKKGMMWKFNPSCLQLFVSNSSFEYNKNKLLEDIVENCSWSHTELDRNSNVYLLQYDIELLLINALQIDKSIIENANDITIQNLVGEIEI